MSILTEVSIWSEITKVKNPLIITPLLDRSQVGAASVDVRIGHQFIILQRPAVTHVDPIELADKSIYQTQQRVRVSHRGSFIIHPGQLVLGSTLEYVAIPEGLAATVEGRSSWGRLGLIIATACSVAPGFKGCITLELLNQGEVPLVLYPGVRIAQLIFQRTEQGANYRDAKDGPKYDCPIGPEFSRIQRDKEMSFWSSRAAAASAQVTKAVTCDAANGSAPGATGVAKPGS